jgi:hypothetical protein
MLLLPQIRPHPQLLPLVISQPRLHKLHQHLLQQNKPRPNQGNLHESLTNINNRPSPSLPPRPALKMTAFALMPNPLSPAMRRIGMIRKM